MSGSTMPSKVELKDHDDHFGNWRTECKSGYNSGTTAPGN